MEAFRYFRTCSYISVLPTCPTLQTSIHIGEAFKASNSLPLGSAMKSNYEQFDLPTVTHQNGFGSTMLFGVPTFISRISSVFRQSECHVFSCMYLAFAVVQNAVKTVKIKCLPKIMGKHRCR